MYITPLADIRAMQRGTTELEAAIEASSKYALVMRPTEADHAELLYLYARSVAYNEERKDEATSLAYRAYELALQTKDYVLAARARCLSLYSNARPTPINRGLTIGQFWQDHTMIGREFDTWIADLDLTEDQIRRIRRFHMKLQEYGDSLAEARGVPTSV